MNPLSQRYLVAGSVFALMLMIVAGIFFWRGGLPNFSQLALSAGAYDGTDIDGAPYIEPELKAVGENVLLYENREFRFSLLIPKGFEGKQYREKGNAMSATFEEPESGRGFQIFVTPYGQPQVTRERFLMDTPSGVMDSPTDIVIGGAQATMFFSKNPVMGETREVWFIKDGFLYEVATYKELDEWLGNIMQGWKFI